MCPALGRLGKPLTGSLSILIRGSFFFFRVITTQTSQQHNKAKTSGFAFSAFDLHPCAHSACPALPCPLAVWVGLLGHIFYQGTSDLEMTEVPSHLSSYLSLDHPPPVTPEGCSCPPNLLPLFLEAQAPGELQGHFGTVPVTIPHGRETL